MARNAPRPGDQKREVIAPTPPATFSPTISPTCAACFAVVTATRFTRVTIPRAPVARLREADRLREVDRLRELAPFRLVADFRPLLRDVDLFRALVERLRVLLRVLLRAVPRRAVLFRRAVVDERLRDDFFRVAIVSISCCGGLRTNLLVFVRKNRAQPRPPQHVRPG